MGYIYRKSKNSDPKHNCIKTKNSIMKKSEKNLMTIENFILYFTTKSEGDDREVDKMYQRARDYIEEDHVDGEPIDKPQRVELVLWETVRADCKYPKEDNNKGYIYGLNLLCENNEEIIEVAWFKSDQERAEYMEKYNLQEYEPTWKCKVCNSEDVELKLWYNLLNEQPTADILEDEDEDTWCIKCEAHTGIEFK